MQLLASGVTNQLDLIIVTGGSKNPIHIPKTKVIFLDLNLSRWFYFKKEFTEILKEEQPDLIHINGIWNPQNALFQKVAQKLGHKVIVSPHGMLEPYIMNRNSLKKKIALSLYQKEAIKNANYLLTTAESELEQIRTLGFTVPAAIIPNGIDISEVKIKRNWPEENSEVIKILFLSRIHPKKRVGTTNRCY